MKLTGALAIVCTACLAEPARPTFDVAAITMACMDYGTAICTARERCSYNHYANARSFGDFATCAARIAQTCVYANLVRGTYGSPAHTEQCASAYPSLSCSDLFDDVSPPMCQPPSGTGAIGSPCATAAECSTSYCSIPAFAACGTCQPEPPPGASCQFAADCGRGIACVIPIGSALGTCTLFAELGMPCLTNVTPCATGLACVGDDAPTMTMGTCRAAGEAVGAPCDGNHKVLPSCDPATGLTCNAVSNGTCQPVVVAAPGGLCGTYAPTGTTRGFATCAASGLCLKATATSPSGTCIAAAADGAACDNDPLVGPPCLTPARCIVTGGGTAGVCKVLEPAACF